MACKAIGIDLGTTYSCVSVFKNGRVNIITNNFGNRITPSCVAFTEDDTLVGDGARNQLAINAANTIYGVKRMIGRRFADECVQNDMKHWPFKVVSGSDGQAMVEVIDKGQIKQYSPEHISSLVLGYLKKAAENFLGYPITDAVITVPANYGDAQRQGTFDAARLAGLNVLRIVNEPTAAALAYGFENILAEGQRNVLVFDLGGGTLDVSILSVDRNNQFEVKATAGNSHLGGDDFDNRILAHFSAEFKRKYQQDLSTDKRAVRRLYAVCERTKRTLSESVVGSVEVDYLFGGRDFQGKIKRDHFELICGDLFQGTLLPVGQALKDAKLEKEAIHEIVLAGGSSRIPKIQRLLQDYFNGHELNKSINPDEAIAYGAAILAAKLSGATVPNIQSISLSDITCLSLGQKNYCGGYVVFIPRGARIPITVKQDWKTSADYQTGASIDVYEGEDSFAANNRLLGKFTVSGFPALPAGQVKSEHVMEIDANGILHASCMEKSTGKKNQISFTRRFAA